MTAPPTTLRALKRSATYSSMRCCQVGVGTGVGLGVGVGVGVGVGEGVGVGGGVGVGDAVGTGVAVMPSGVAVA